MRRIFFGLLLIGFLLTMVATALAANISLCRSTEVEWVRFELVGATELPADSWYVADGAGLDERGRFVLDALADGTVQIGIPDATEGYIIIDGNSSTPVCGSLYEGDAPSIAVAITSDCAYVEIDNGDGGWSRVESNGEPVLLHYGEQLIAGRSQSLEPEHYRAVPTACY